MSNFESAEGLRRDFGNLLNALIAHEATTCKGCVWGIGKITLGDQSLCAKNHLMRKRCKEYVDSQPYVTHWRNRNAATVESVPAVQER